MTHLIYNYYEINVNSKYIDNKIVPKFQNNKIDYSSNYFS